jgi:hypothetical protein
VTAASSTRPAVAAPDPPGGEDPGYANRFARYWRLIRPASGAIGRSWLTAIKRRAERQANGTADPEVPAR